MVRVCVITDGLPHDHGGAELRAFRHARYLQAGNRVNSSLIAWDRSAGKSQDNTLPDYVHPVKLFLQEYRHKNATVRFVQSMLHVGESFARLSWLLFSLRRQIDVFHVIYASPWFNLLSIPAAKALDKPVILEMVSLGDDDPLTLNRRRSHPEQQLFPHRPLKYSLFLKADAYVSKSLALSQAYHKAGLPGSKLFQIFSGVDTDLFSPPTGDEKTRLRRKLGFPIADTVIIFVGGVRKLKGVHHLTAAFRETAAQHPQSRLVIVGPSAPYNPSYATQLRDDVAAWGLSERVHFVGRVTNVHEYMRAGDIFVLPSSREGLSVAILEAMACELAIVASNIPEIALSQIESGVEGLLVPVGDTTQLAQSLAKLMKDPGLRDTLGRSARRRVLREFTLDTVGSQYVELYESLARN